MSDFNRNNFIRTKWQFIVAANLTNYAVMNNGYIFNLFPIFESDSNNLIIHSGFRLGQ